MYMTVHVCVMALYQSNTHGIKWECHRFITTLYCCIYELLMVLEAPVESMCLLAKTHLTLSYQRAHI